MSASMSMPLTIALAGNPNCGKTTLFNAVTGANQFVGNWPGVTVEKKEGKLKGREDVLVADLPGIYSLSPYSPEERVARNYLVEVRPDVILNLVDGTSIERSLFLTTQFAELGIPMVVAINMLDLLQKKGDTIDLVRLSKSLGCPVLLLSAHTGDGVQEIIACALEQAKTEAMLPKHLFSGDVEHALAHIEEAVLHDLPEERQRYYALKLFERDEDVIQSLHITGDKLSHIEKDIIACEKELDDDSVSILTTQRYAYIDNILQGCVVKQKRSKVETSDRIDRVLTHRFLGLPIFAAILFLIYYISVSTVGAVALGWVNDGIFGDGFAFFGAWVPGLPVLVGNLLETLHAAPWISSLLLDGIIAGVGSVLGFVPQMLVLFFFLAFLEACGYMSRIAFIMDRVFRRFGLSGKSIIPILIGTGCGVPGIMASRTIENERDRKMTIITTTFIPCGAKLPIIAMISEALFENSWWVAPSAYFVGIAAILSSGLILKRTKPFQGAEAPFVMELPTYHMPTAINLLRSMWERGWSFIKKAGTIILLATIVIWFGSNFGWNESGFGMVSMQDSLLAMLGSAIAWIFIPLGWGDWQSTVAMLTGLVAKENVVGTFGVLFQQADAPDASLYTTIASYYNALSGYSFLIFNLLCAPCFAAIGAIRREMNNAKWFWMAIGYQCGYAYIVSLIVYQIGRFISVIL